MRTEELRSGGCGKPLEFLLQVSRQLLWQEVSFQSEETAAADVPGTKAGQIGGVDLGIYQLAATAAECLRKKYEG